MITAQRSNSRRALTLLELLLAVAITVLTGLAIAAVTTSIARGLTSMNESRSALQRAYAAHARLRAYTTGALAFISVDPDRGIAIWHNDDRYNNRVNLSELRIFWLEPSSDGTPGKELVIEMAAFPEEWEEDELELADAELAGVDDPFNEMLALRAQGWTSRSVIADGLESISVSHSAINLVHANRIRISLKVQIGADNTEDILMAFGLPNHKVPG